MVYTPYFSFSGYYVMMDFCDECDAVIEGKICKKCHGDKEGGKQGEGDSQDGPGEEDVPQEIKDRWEK